VLYISKQTFLSHCSFMEQWHQ